ncbi:unnamed protein product [Closterium sp. NIES-53]
MATPSVLPFDAEGRAVDFEVWVDDLQLFLQCDRADGLSLFDLTSGASPAPPATADSTVRSQWATRDAAAHLAVRRHLPTTERAHFSQYRSAQTLYDAVVARYSSPATATLSRLFLPYLFPDLTPLSRLVAVSLADPSGGPVLASFSTVLPCPAAPSGTLSGLYLPSFSTNLVSGADLQDQGVDQFTPASQRVTHCTCARTGRHLATFNRRPGSSLYTLSTESPPVPPLGQVAASSKVLATPSGPGPESAPCSCRLLSHQTLLWHHRLGHPSLHRLRGMASHVLVSGLPRSLPTLPSGPTPTYVPCVEGRQRAAPHSSTFPPTEAPLQTLHMDVWGPARVRGQGHERYFLLVVDDYSRYTTVFPLRSKGDVTEVLIDWIRAAHLQLRESFGSDFPVLQHMAAAKRVLRYLCSTSGLGLVLGGRRPVVLTGHADASWADDQTTQRSSQGYTFSLGSGSVSWRSTRSSSVLGSSCEAEIYAGAMAAQELRWLTYLLTDLGEQPRSPSVLYANTADIFTKALPPGDHQRFCTMLACFVLLDWSCDLLFSPTLPMGVCQTYML